jgi:GrpB-like predicted nucleotidyltransferase (UPF0157 family)
VRLDPWHRHAYHNDSDEATWLFHFGRLLRENPNGSKLFFIGEGRLFLGELDDIDYQFWGALLQIARR